MLGQFKNVLWSKAHFRWSLIPNVSQNTITFPIEFKGKFDFMQLQFFTLDSQTIPTKPPTFSQFISPSPSPI